MALSMTGYGSGTCCRDGREITIELKSVNHRYLDLSYRSPKVLSYLEDAVRKQIQSRLARGHVDIYVTYKNTRDDAKNLICDERLASAYIKAAKNFEAFGLKNDLTASTLLQIPGIIVEEDSEEDCDAILEITKEALDSALDSLITMRKTEGENLKADLLLHSAAVIANVDKIEARLPAIEEESRNRLREKVNEILSSEVSSERLEEEIVLIVERGAIDEETSRLRSHVSQMAAILEENEPVGRRLDFLIQEMNREINTTGSKSSDTEIANLVVNTKSEIEKLREQIQNVE